MIILFVYGTLRAGERLHKYVREAMAPKGSPDRIGGVGGILTGYSLMDGPGYPYALGGNAGDRIFGELYVVDPNSKGFKDIDRIEQGAGYTPMAVDVLVADAGDQIDDAVSTIKALAYVIPAEERDQHIFMKGVIPGGDWVEHTRERQPPVADEVEVFALARALGR